jgi:hypothetical protein
VGNTIRDQVFTVLQKQPGIPFSIKGVHAKMQHCSYEQVANSLADLVLFDERVVRTARGVYVYEGTPATADVPAATSKQPLRVAEEPKDLGEENPEDGRYFTQVGVAENGDIIITRDTDGKVYRATPL